MNFIVELLLIFLLNTAKVFGIMIVSFLFIFILALIGFFNKYDMSDLKEIVREVKARTEKEEYEKKILKKYKK